MTEGGFDAASGSTVFPNIVSSLTNSLFAEQFWVLEAIADKVVVVYDGDEKGIEGAEMVKAKYPSKKLMIKIIPGKDLNKLKQDLSPEKYERELNRYLRVISK